MANPDRQISGVKVVFEGDLPIDPIARALSRREILRRGGVVIPSMLTRPYDERLEITKLSHVPDRSVGPGLNLPPPVTDSILRRVKARAAVAEQRRKGHR